MAKRTRGQNEASIYKRKSDGYWVGAVSVGNGKRKTVYGKVRADVVRKTDAIRTNLSQGIRPAKTMVVAELIAQWLNMKKSTIRLSTYQGYELTLGKHVLPVLGTMNIANVKPTDLERLYADCAKTISPKSIRNVHAALKQAFDWGARRDWLARNPAALIAPTDLPKIVRTPPEVLTAEQARKLIDVAAGTRSEALIALAVTIGCRVGELTAITWDRVDLGDKRNSDKPVTVRIDRALHYVDGKPVLLEPKTPAGVRDVTLAPTASIPLRKLRSEQNQNALRLGKAWSNPLDLVFTTETGNPLNRRQVLKQYFRPLLKEAGLPEKMQFHTLRHGAASLLLAAGVPVTLVSRMLGHSTPSFTLSVYSHAVPNSQHVVANAMESILGN